jgi:ATP-dependent DNA helicase RecQ
LALREPNVVITRFDRPNLSYQSRRIPKVREKDAELIQLLRNQTGSAIVYCATRKAVDAVSEMLSRELKGRTIVSYHAGLDQTVRTNNQERFMQTPHAIAIATNAFGMGINKPDIRLVVHYNLPGTLEAYYQEAGRAGRDGLPARCVVLFSYQDRFTQEFFIDKIGQDRDGVDPAVIERLKQRARDKLDLMLRYAQTHRCRRQMILDYFGDESEISGCVCDTCSAGNSVIEGPDGSVAGAAPIIPDEVTMLVRQLLSGIARLNGKFGVGMIADVLIGSEGERMWKWGLDKLSVHGLLRAHSGKRVIAMLHRMMEAGLARQKNVGIDKPIHVVELTAAGIAVMKGEQPPPATLIDIAPRAGSTASATRPRAQISSEPDTPLDEDAAERFQRLRAARAELARAADLPAFCICHDSTLKSIARYNPDSLEKLEQIKGMGPHKLRSYGQRFLDALSHD